MGSFFLLLIPNERINPITKSDKANDRVKEKPR